MLTDRSTSDASLSARALTRAYLLAKEEVIASGFESEIAWQEQASPRTVTETTFVREAAWVVLCTGMREAVVRDRFAALARAFGEWCPAYISRNSDLCRRHAKGVFNHGRKLDAIVQIAREVDNLGVDGILHGIHAEGPTYLTWLPYIGEVTCFHLAKNLGYPVAKPDRHLSRLASALGYADAFSLCVTISTELGEPVQVVDIVLWRFATLNLDHRTWMQTTVSSSPAHVLGV